MKTTTLLAATLFSFLIAGQSATAGQNEERDEYSIGVVWETDASQTTNRTNYSIQENTEETSLDEIEEDRDHNP